jgi:HlyD family secretion protein
MNIKSLIFYVLIPSCVLLACVQGYKFLTKTQTPPLFKTAHPTKKNIRASVSATGILEIKNVLKIGSLVSGTIDNMYVKENQFVKKGQLLAHIDMGKDDTDIQAAQARLDRANQELIYQKQVFKRQTQLYQAHQISQNAFDKFKADYLKSYANVKTEAAGLKKAMLDLQYSNIRAPDDGIITVVNATKGIAIIPDFTYVMFEIAHDITEMKATLDIDESDIGKVKPDQKVRISFNAFPHITLKGAIKEISYTPKGTSSTGAKNGGQQTDSALFYKAIIDIKNDQRFLRPGMLVNAKINIAKGKDVLSISGLAFQINTEHVKTIAHPLGYNVKQLSHQDKKLFKHAHPNTIIRHVWIVQNKEFIQKSVTLGISDDNDWEITSGLTASDNVIVDLQEPGDLDKLYKAWFKGAL